MRFVIGKSKQKQFFILVLFVVRGNVAFFITMNVNYGQKINCEQEALQWTVVKRRHVFKSQINRTLYVRYLRRKTEENDRWFFGVFGEQNKTRKLRRKLMFCFVFFF